MILHLSNIKLLLSLLKKEINKHRLILSKKISEFKVYSNSIDTYLFLIYMKLC